MSYCNSLIYNKSILTNVLLLICSLFITYSLNAHTNCNSNMNSKNYYQDQNSYYNSNCPCFNSVADIREAIGNNPLPRSCVSRADFSLLTDGPFTYTIEEYGNSFSCFYRNINTGKKDEFVQFGNQDEVKAMQSACNAVLRKFAVKYSIPCD